MAKRPLLVGAVLIAAATARAESRPEAQALMKDYLDGEKTGGYILVGMGIGGITAGTLLVRSDSPVQRGLSYPLLATGALQVAAGVYVGMVSDRRITDFNVEIAREGQAWTERERARMDGVQTQFTVLKLVELGMIAGGAGLAYYGHRRGWGRLQGAGLGIALEAAATLAFDVWASRRADRYRDRLGSLVIAPRLRLAF